MRDKRNKESGKLIEPLSIRQDILNANILGKVLIPLEQIRSLGFVEQIHIARFIDHPYPSYETS